jgi:hypothetical protein
MTAEGTFVTSARQKGLAKAYTHSLAVGKKEKARG